MHNFYLLWVGFTANNKVPIVNLELVVMQCRGCLFEECIISTLRSDPLFLA